MYYLDKINQTAFFRKCILACQNMSKVIVVGQPRKKDWHWKCLKITFFAQYFLKNVKDKALSFLLIKFGKVFSAIKTWCKTSNSSQNYGPSNLIFRFNDFYIYDLNWMQKKVGIMLWVPIFKTYSKMNTYLKVWSICAYSA